MKQVNGHNDTALIVAYYGKIPPYLPLFLDSCKQNADIDFIFFTDWNSDKLISSENIKFIKSSLDEFNKLSNSKIQIGDVVTPYKLCDLKPAWTHIFEDYLREYKFVGYCDIDLIFGRIAEFFSEDVKRRCDMFSITTSYLSGALTIFKNTPQMRTLYQKASGWRYIFSDARHWAFDEYLRIDNTKSDDAKANKLESFSDLVFSSRSNVVLENSRYIGLESRPDLVTYDNGRWLDKEDREYVFFHFVGAKQNPMWTTPNWESLPEKFFVNKYGFFKYGESPLRCHDLFIRPYLRKQVLINWKNKLKTARTLIRNMDVKMLVRGIKKYI